MVAAAIIGSAVVGAGVSASAANKAAKGSQAATDANTALQQQTLAQQQANTAVARGTGDAALNSLATRFGLNNGTNGAASSGAPAGGSAAQPGFDVGAFESAISQVNPGIIQEANRVVADGEFPSKEAYYQWHDQQFPNEVRPYLSQFATTPAAAPATNTQAPATTQPTGTPLPGSAGSVDANGAYTVARPEIAPAPTYRETSIAPLDVGLDKYQQSPDYNFQLDQGNKNILANASATGGLESGAALKALQTFGQNLAMGDYGQWRDYTTGQYNNDRAFTANRDDAANAFNTNQYQYGTTLQQNAYNSDRDYSSNRYDTQTNALMSLAGYGQNATGQSNNALASNASNIANGYFSNANNQGNAALAGAGQANNLLAQGGNALAYYYGNGNGGAKAGTTPLYTGINQAAEAIY
jgi:hypothetical protein